MSADRTEEFIARLRWGLSNPDHQRQDDPHGMTITVTTTRSIKIPGRLRLTLRARVLSPKEWPVTYGKIMEHFLRVDGTEDIWANRCYLRIDRDVVIGEIDGLDPKSSTRIHLER